MKKRNGEIELLRFLFAVTIMLLHFNTRLDLGCFYNGSIGVEFFFLVSGYFLAKYAKKVTVDKKEIPQVTWKYVFKKISVFYSYLLIIGFVKIIFLTIANDLSKKQIFSYILKALPRYFLLCTTTIADNGIFYVDGSWYLSAMILSMLILLPMLLSKYDISSKIIFPVFGLFTLGAIYLNFNAIQVTGSKFLGLFNVGFIRALAEIALGSFCYEMTETVKSKYPNVSQMINRGGTNCCIL